MRFRLVQELTLKPVKEGDTFTAPYVGPATVVHAPQPYGGTSDNRILIRERDTVTISVHPADFGLRWQPVYLP